MFKRERNNYPVIITALAFYVLIHLNIRFYIDLYLISHLFLYSPFMIIVTFAIIGYFLTKDLIKPNNLDIILCSCSQIGITLLPYFVLGILNGINLFTVKLGFIIVLPILGIIATILCFIRSSNRNFLNLISIITLAGLSVPIHLVSKLLSWMTSLRRRTKNRFKPGYVIIASPDETPVPIFQSPWATKECAHIPAKSIVNAVSCKGKWVELEIKNHSFYIESKYVLQF